MHPSHSTRGKRSHGRCGYMRQAPNVPCRSCLWEASMQIGRSGRLEVKQVQAGAGRRWAHLQEDAGEDHEEDGK